MMKEQASFYGQMIQNFVNDAIVLKGYLRQKKNITHISEWQTNSLRLNTSVQISYYNKVNVTWLDIEGF